MHEGYADKHDSRRPGPGQPTRPDISANAISQEEIFRQLIADEVRAGRLTPARRRRIVRYAAQLRLSAVDVGLMIAQCREEALQSQDQTERLHALRLVEPPTPRIPIAYKLSAVVLAAIIINLLLMLTVLD